MAITVNTNVTSMKAQKNLNTSSSGLATSMERLSSGLRINSAKDDANKVLNKVFFIFTNPGRIKGNCTNNTLLR